MESKQVAATTKISISTLSRGVFWGLVEAGKYVSRGVLSLQNMLD